MKAKNLLIENIGELLTLAPLAKEKRVTHVDEKDLGKVQKAWLALENGKVASFGSGAVDGRYRDYPKVDANGGLVMPGLVDAHTHPIFAGNRAHEFADRLRGKSYQQIAAAGGGIQYTVKQTRAASEEELAQMLDQHLQKFLQLGVTTLEAKSGYGLNVEQELRLLKVLRQAQNRTPQKIVSTCLALHALGREFKSNKDFVKCMSEELLPEVKRQNLAEYVDGFIENGYFSVQDGEPFFARARELGLGIRVHADEFADSGAALASARWGAKSADHLQNASAEGIAAMAESNTVAVLLPGTSLYCALPYTNGKRFIQAGCAVALATDFNPGSCRVDNLAFIATIGALHCGLTPAQAIAAVTYVPALSLQLETSKGALAPGHDADFLMYDFASADEWLANLGQTPPNSVWIRGASVST